MRFTLLAAAAACGSLAVRPQVGRASAMAKVGALSAKISSSPSDSLAALKAATGIVNEVFAEAGNATDHLSSDDTAVLTSVLDLVEKTIYSSMDTSQTADVASLNSGVGTADQCNTIIAERQAANGDLGEFKQSTQDEQTELNRLDGVVAVKREINDTKWTALSDHMSWIAAPPDCPGLPERSMGPLDLFFEKSAYVIWFNMNKPLYEVKRDAFIAADEALTSAISNYNLHLAVRDTSFCDWKMALEAACGTFDTCFASATAEFSDIVERVTTDMNSRIEVKKAGDTLMHQIDFLLGNVNNQETPPIDTTRYQIDFPVLPEKGLCDLSPLGDAMWVPAPSCDKRLLLDGCSVSNNLELTGFGSPREEAADKVEGEAVCCNDQGKATRHIHNGEPVWPPNPPHHSQCTTTSTLKLEIETKPSHTFYQAKAICEQVGLRLCSSQAEVNTACNTGCWINGAVVWVE